MNVAWILLLVGIILSKMEMGMKLNGINGKVFLSLLPIPRQYRGMAYRISVDDTQNFENPDFDGGSSDLSSGSVQR